MLDARLRGHDDFSYCDSRKGANLLTTHEPLAFVASHEGLKLNLSAPGALHPQSSAPDSKSYGHSTLQHYRQRRQTNLPLPIETQSVA